MEIDKQKKLITQLISTASRINDSSKNASYIKIPIENIELIANELNITFEEALDELSKYFNCKKNFE